VSTNYYLRTDQPTGIDQDSVSDSGIHLGKLSGQRFHVRARPGLIDTYDQWAALVRTGTVVAEHGLEEDSDEFLAWVLKTARGARFEWPQGEQYAEHGLIFTPSEFC
jgi:hypothetical protein